MKLKQILRCKRGIALENAVLFIVVTFSLCALLSSLTLIGHYQIKNENIIFTRDIEIDQIGDDFLAGIKTGVPFTGTYENYAYEVSGNALSTLTVWRKADESKTPVLYVEAALVEGKVRVSQWRYSLPPQTE